MSKNMTIKKTIFPTILILLGLIAAIVSLVVPYLGAFEYPGFQDFTIGTGFDCIFGEDRNSALLGAYIAIIISSVLLFISLIFSFRPQNFFKRFFLIVSGLALLLSGLIFYFSPYIIFANTVITLNISLGLLLPAICSLIGGSCALLAAISN